jgi:hypothetical protein
MNKDYLEDLPILYDLSPEEIHYMDADAVYRADLLAAAWKISGNEMPATWSFHETKDNCLLAGVNSELGGRQSVAKYLDPDNCISPRKRVLLTNQSPALGSVERFISQSPIWADRPSHSTWVDGGKGERRNNVALYRRADRKEEDDESEEDEEEHQTHTYTNTDDFIKCFSGAEESRQGGQQHHVGGAGGGRRGGEKGESARHEVELENSLFVQMVLDFRLSDLGGEVGLLEFSNDLVIDVAEVLFVIYIYIYIYCIYICIYLYTYIHTYIHIGDRCGRSALCCCPSLLCVFSSRREVGGHLENTPPRPRRCGPTLCYVPSG